MGGPDSEAAVAPFLTNLFLDPEILPLPLPGFLRGFVARRIAAKRAVKVLPRYRLLGGKSPQGELTARQAQALQARLNAGGGPALARARRDALLAPVHRGGARGGRRAAPGAPRRALALPPLLARGRRQQHRRTASRAAPAPAQLPDRHASTSSSATRSFSRPTPTGSPPRWRSSPTAGATPSCSSRRTTCRRSSSGRATPTSTRSRPPWTGCCRRSASAPGAWPSRAAPAP